MDLSIHVEGSYSRSTYLNIFQEQIHNLTAAIFSDEVGIFQQVNMT